MIFETSRKIYVCATKNYELKQEMAWTTYNKFSMWKKKTIFRFFLEKLQIGGNNFSKVINTSSIQLMVLYLIKIVSNHSWAKIKEKIHFFGKKNSWKWNWFIPMQSFGIIVSKLFIALFYWFLAYCIFSLTNSTYGKFYEKNMNQFHEFFLKIPQQRTSVSIGMWSIIWSWSDLFFSLNWP